MNLINEVMNECTDRVSLK
jgi:26S proteasome regulatory subunit N1